MPENHNFNLDKDRQIFSNDILTVTKEKIPNINANICSDDNNLLKATPYIQSDNKNNESYLTKTRPREKV